MKSPAKTTVSKILSRKVLIGSNSRLIFCYHDVSDKDSPQYSELYSTTSDNFRAQIEFLVKYFDIVSLEEIVSTEKSKRGKRLACLTFDDGFLSVKETVLPYLESLGVPFAVFANKTAIQTNSLSYDSRFAELNRTYDEKVYMDEIDLKELSRKGILIGNHTTNHKILAGCDDTALRDEIVGNKQFLEKILDREIRHFAIPYGKREHYDKRVLDSCSASGHDFVYSTNPVYFNRSILNQNEKPIPRIGLTNQSPDELCFLINRPLLKKIDI